MRLPAKTFGELVALAKAKPDALNYATLGPNTTQNLILSMILKKLGISMTQVPYSSAAQIYPDLLTGRVDVRLDNMPNVVPFVKRKELASAGRDHARTRVRAARRADRRGVPALPGLRDGGVGGLVAPAGTPPDVIATIRAAYGKALESEEYRSWAETNAPSRPRPRSSPNFAEFLRQQLGIWMVAAEESGVAIAK